MNPMSAFCSWSSWLSKPDPDGAYPLYVIILLVSNSLPLLLCLFLFGFPQRVTRV
jgi:hypothetical protein